MKSPVFIIFLQQAVNGDYHETRRIRFAS